MSVEITPTPSLWSVGNPLLQVTWDATSLALFTSCPWKYHLVMHEGWRGMGNVHTGFGGLFASATEVFKKARLAGESKEAATVKAARWAFDNSGSRGEDGVWKPWGGHYESQWHCTGSEPYHNAKGNAAKCPYSHKGKWFPGPGPSICGECGSPTHEEWRWIPDDKLKDRLSLVRAVVWYGDEATEDGAEGLRPYAFPDGTPAVELTWRIPSPWKTPYGETYILSGYFDGIVEYGNGHDLFIADDKTTKNALGQAYFQHFSPNIQVDLYDMVAPMLFPDLPIRGVLIEAMQVQVGGVRFGKSPQYRSPAQRQEFADEVAWTLKEAERSAETGYYPMRRTSCYTCDFKGICSKDPAKREMFLKADFEKRFWDPTQDR